MIVVRILNFLYQLWFMYVNNLTLIYGLYCYICKQSDRFTPGISLHYLNMTSKQINSSSNQNICKLSSIKCSQEERFCVFGNFKFRNNDTSERFENFTLSGCYVGESDIYNRNYTKTRSNVRCYEGTESFTSNLLVKRIFVNFCLCGNDYCNYAIMDNWTNRHNRSFATKSTESSRILSSRFEKFSKIKQQSNSRRMCWSNLTTTARSNISENDKFKLEDAKTQGNLMSDGTLLRKPDYIVLLSRIFVIIYSIKP